MKTVLLLALLLSLSSAALVRTWQKSQDPSTLSNTLDFETTHFNLEVELDFENHQIIGRQTLHLNALRQGISQIDLDISSIEILSIQDVRTHTQLEYSIYSPDPNLFGDQLKIYLTSATRVRKNSTIIIAIDYISTNPDAASWLTPEQTDSKVLPYMYTQCQSVACRSVAPFQDSPSIKSTFEASITVPNPMVAYLSGNFTGTQSHPTKLDHTIYKFESTIPMASYLFTIVAGNLVEKKIDWRTSVISEPTHIEYYAVELDEIDVFLTTIEDYVIPYAWGSYKIVIMPPSFPMGGMENPLLTFASPSIIVGDKSGVSVAVHEIAHSWSGNLVTCKDWSNLWLNEGFTMYLERTADAIMFGKDYSVIDSVVGNDTVVDDMLEFGLQSNYTSLHPHLVGVNPDDAFSNVPYEKGYQFLMYIEQVIGKNTLQSFLRAYFSQFAFQSVGYIDVKEFFQQFVLNTFGQIEGKRINEEINWDEWVLSPGFPPVNLAFSTPTIPLIKQLAQQFLDLDGSQPSNYQDFEEYSLNEKAIFLQYLYDNLDQVTEQVIRRLDENYQLTQSPNKEISWRWFRVTILANYTNNLNRIDEFLGSIGRIKMIKPVYQALDTAGHREIAILLLKKYQNFYHPLAVLAVQRVLGISS